ncbi:MAG: hypothetical protein J5J06_09840 [Phycisphaerae bacterium]|nr:hypothetical protein [Phycisphaerae bacterium]
MKRWLTTICAVVAVGLMTAATYACDKPCAGCKSAGESGCAFAKPAQMASDKAGCEGKCAEKCKGDCSKCDGKCDGDCKNARLASDTGCAHAKQAKTDSADGGCPHAKAQTASSEGGCGHAKQAQMASSEGGCGHAKAQMASDKGSCGGCKGSCDGKCDGGCKGLKAVLTSLPSMQYRVGDQTMSCPKSAAKMAQDSGKSMQYVVADKTFDNRHDALVELASMLEAEAESMQSMQYAVGDEAVQCPMTAKSMAEKAGKPMHYRVAGVDFESKDQAEKAVQLVKDAAANVKISYKVGEKSFCCDKMAGVEAKKTSDSIHYIVGQTEVDDDAEAKVVLANERIRSMVEAASSLTS